jgi:intracellular sulfur oxidation DsrE/DsrF family protein
MKEEDTVDRRAVMAGLGIAAAGLVASTANAQTASRKAGSKFQPARHDVDAWFDQLPGSHRVFVDTASADGAAEGIGYANNLYIATDSAYAGQQATPAIVVCFRHFSTPFGYNDAMWEKYGQIFHSLIQYPDPMTGGAPKVNLMNSNAHKMLANRGVTIDALAAKGAQFAICNMATQFIAGAIAQQTGRKANEVHDELVANAVGNSHFVSAGVMALTRAQEYGYSLLIA